MYHRHPLSSSSSQQQKTNKHKKISKHGSLRYKLYISNRMTLNGQENLLWPISRPTANCVRTWWWIWWQPLHRGLRTAATPCFGSRPRNLPGHVQTWSCLYGCPLCCQAPENGRKVDWLIDWLIDWRCFKRKFDLWLEILQAQFTILLD